MDSFTSRGSVLDGVNGDFAVREFRLPPPGPGGVIVRQELAGMCGTDYHVFRGHWPSHPFPVLLGHENGFEVDVTEHWKDMRAAELSRYDVLVLNNANELDLVLPEEQRKAVEDWFTKGKKGIVGRHAALVHQT